MTHGRLACALALGCAACDGTHVDLERMIDQRKYEAYEASPLFADGKAMRSPPRGTVPRGAPSPQSPLESGSANGHYVTDVPLPLTRQLLERGQDRFNLYCATCHGLLGDGTSKVAENMLLRPPPSLHEARIRQLPVGELYAVIRDGYGLMPAYAGALSTPDRWAVVSYVGALQLSQRTSLAALPTNIQQEAAAWLK